MLLTFFYSKIFTFSDIRFSKFYDENPRAVHGVVEQFESFDGC